MRKYTSVFSVLVVAILILPGIGRALEVNEWVSVMNLPYSYTYSNYALVNIHLTDVFEPTTLGLQFEDSEFDFMLYVGSKYIGTVRQDESVMYIVTVSSATTIKFQSSNGLKFKIIGQGENLTVTQDDITVKGDLHDDGAYHTISVSLPEENPHNVTVTLNGCNDTSYFLGICDDAISEFGLITGESTFHIHRADAYQGFKIIAPSSATFEAEIEEADDIFYHVHQSQEVVFESYGANILVSGDIMAKYQNTPDIPSVIRVDNVVNFFSWEDKDNDSCPEIALYKYDLELHRSNPLVKLNGVKVVFGQFLPEFKNQTITAIGDPDDLDPYINASITNPIGSVMYDIDIIDDDRDGRPIVKVYNYNLTWHNGTLSEGIASTSIYSWDKWDNNPKLPRDYGDLDNDGLSNYYEAFRTKTNPLDNDTDDDGEFDSLELFTWEGPLTDADGDGLGDHVEYILGLNPYDRDTDDDYFEDYAEMKYLLYRHFNSWNSTAISELNDLYLYETIDTAPIPEWLQIDNDEDGVLDFLDKNSDDELLTSFGYSAKMNEFNLTLDINKKSIISAYRDIIDAGKCPLLNTTFFNATNITTERMNYTLEHADINHQIVVNEYEYRKLLLTFIQDDNITNATRQYYVTQFDESFFLAFEAYLQLIEEAYYLDEDSYEDLKGQFLEDYHACYSDSYLLDINRTFWQLVTTLEEWDANKEIDFYMCKYFDLDGNELIYYFTDPLVHDSDNDSFPDGQEINYWKSIDLSPIGDIDSDGTVNIFDSDSDGDLTLDGFDFDIDNDTMQDIFEYRWDLDMFDYYDAFDDPDDDGLENYMEFYNDTCPQDSDTDDDGLNDSYEISFGLCPTSKDSDADGIEDDVEWKWWNDTDGDGYINALDSDSDNDGLIDSEEDTNKNGLIYPIEAFETSPVDSDTDNDTLPDGWEVNNNLGALYALTPSQDDDGDGLTNKEEFLNGTDPQDMDTDGDLIYDKWEIDHLFNPKDASDGASDEDQDQLNLTAEYLNTTQYWNPDTDFDLLPDGWEILHQFNPKSSVTPGNDPDSDNLNNSMEYFAKTDPNDNDTDDDAMPDGWEFENSLDPLVDDANQDPDQDSYTNLQEYQNQTNPQLQNYDDDGLPSEWENSTGLNPFRNDADFDYDNDGLNNTNEYSNNTHPFKPDTDGDGIPDGWEVYYNLTPTDNSDGDDDTDSDTLSNLEEYQNQTNPNNWDTDWDKIPDVWEIDNDFNPSASDYGTDSDDDGLTNSEEYTYGMSADWDYIEDGIYENGLDILDPDTDDDNMLDGYEVLCGLDPRNNTAEERDGDLDNDTLSNYAESLLGTRADKIDSDDDDIEDKLELYPFLREYINNTNYNDQNSNVTMFRYWKNKLTGNITHWIGMNKGEWVTFDFQIPEAGIYSIQVPLRVGKDPYVSIKIKDDNNTEMSYRKFIVGRTNSIGFGKVNYYGSVSTLLEPGNYSVTIRSHDELVGLFRGIYIYQISSRIKPILADYDGDGLLDGYSVWVHNQTGEIVPENTQNATEYLGELDLGTSPVHADSDGDGLLDGHNMTYHGDFYLGEMSLGTNPNKADMDEDGLSDWEEVVFGRDGWITDPKDYDSDNDGLWDGWWDKNLNGIYDNKEPWGEWNYHSDPNNKDTDRDGTNDGIDKNPTQDSIVLVRGYNNDPNRDKKFRVTLWDGAVWGSSISFTSKEISSTSDDFQIFYNIMDKDSTVGIKIQAYNSSQGVDYLRYEKSISVRISKNKRTLTSYEEEDNRSGVYVYSGYLKKEHTIIFGSNDPDRNPIDTALYEPSTSIDDFHRYSGDSGFYVFYLDMATGINDTIRQGINAWLIPSSVFFSSSFYEDFNTSGGDLGNISYLPESSAYYNNSRAKPSISILAVYSFEINVESAKKLYDNITHNLSGDLVYKSTIITRSVTVMGIPAVVVDVIPYDTPIMSDLGKIKLPEDDKSKNLWEQFEDCTSSAVDGVVSIGENLGINDYGAALGGAIIGTGQWIINGIVANAPSFLEDIWTFLEEYVIPDVLFEIAQLLVEVLETIVEIVLSALNWLIQWVKDRIGGVVNRFFDNCGVEDYRNQINRAHLKVFNSTSSCSDLNSSLTEESKQGQIIPMASKTLFTSYTSGRFIMTIGCIGLVVKLLIDLANIIIQIVSGIASFCIEAIQKAFSSSLESISRDYLNEWIAASIGMGAMFAYEVAAHWFIPADTEQLTQKIGSGFALGGLVVAAGKLVYDKHFRSAPHSKIESDVKGLIAALIATIIPIDNVFGCIIASILAVGGLVSTIKTKDYSDRFGHFLLKYTEEFVAGASVLYVGARSGDLIGD